MKISLAAENNRTVFQKLREAALAYHLTRRWSKDQILRNYLNPIYFGNGAYGIESAARTYFSYNHDGCGGRRAQAAAAVREGPAPARGRAAGRRWSPRRARTTRSSTRSPPRSGATSCCCACSSRATSPRSLYESGKAAGAARRATT